MRELTIKVVTPLFGGGVEPGFHDPITIIRPTSIRGHLRFWWRLTRSHSFSGTECLFEREAKIWGSTENPSPIVIQVIEVTGNQPQPCAPYEVRESQGRSPRRLVWNELFSGKGEGRNLPYILFPFQGKLTDDKRGVETEPAKFVTSVRFKLRIEYPPHLCDDVEAAIWGWLNFGGIGARTRRGLGALFCEEFAPKDEKEFGEWFISKRWKGAAADFAQAIVYLAQSQPFTPLRALNELVGLLRDFRQGVGFGRNKGQNPNQPGRSRWPEPETIRRVTGKRAAQHQRLHQIPDDLFPRAEFGLPIIVHFKDRGEPNDTETVPVIEGGVKGRMASPVIIRPLVLKNGNAFPLIIWLKRDLPKVVAIRSKGKELGRAKVVDPKSATYPNSPIQAPYLNQPLPAVQGIVLDAFLNFLEKKHGFKRI